MNVWKRNLEATTFIEFLQGSDYKIDPFLVKLVNLTTYSLGQQIYTHVQSMIICFSVSLWRLSIASFLYGAAT